ncbi:MAG: hypothetical protein ACLTXI_08690 [Collinsella sp.]
MRIYNGSDKVIKLERKKKCGSWIHKEDAPLTRGEFEQILAGDYDFLLWSPIRSVASSTSSASAYDAPADHRGLRARAVGDG